MRIAAFILCDSCIVAGLRNCESQAALAIDGGTINGEVESATHLAWIGSGGCDEHPRPPARHAIPAPATSAVLRAQHFGDDAALVIDWRCEDRSTGGLDGWR